MLLAKVEIEISLFELFDSKVHLSPLSLIIKVQFRENNHQKLVSSLKPLVWEEKIQMHPDQKVLLLQGLTLEWSHQTQRYQIFILFALLRFMHQNQRNRLSSLLVLKFIVMTLNYFPNQKDLLVIFIPFLLL